MLQFRDLVCVPFGFSFVPFSLHIALQFDHSDHSPQLISISAIDVSANVIHMSLEFIKLFKLEIDYEYSFKLQIVPSSQFFPPQPEPGVQWHV